MNNISLIKRSCLFITLMSILLLFGACSGNENKHASEIQPEQVYIDSVGVIRWIDTEEEIALFGANYCLPSACDYRAAKYLTDDLRTAISNDLTHFVRMGWDGLRVCFWGDFENTDSLGNLVNNEHLELMEG